MFEKVSAGENKKDKIKLSVVWIKKYGTLNILQRDFKYYI